MVLGKRSRKGAWTPKKKMRKTKRKSLRANWTGSQQRTISTNRGTTILRNAFGMPDNLETTLVYGDSIILTPGVSAFASKAYSLTSLYDPDPAVGGAQPYFFDQLMAIYGRYTVIGAKLTATFTYDRGNSDTSSGPWVNGCIGSDASTLASTSTDVLIASQNSDYQPLGRGGEAVDCQATYSPWKSLGYTSTDSQLSGTSTSNPAKNYYAHVWCSPQGTSTTSVMNVLVRVEYRVRFHEVIDNTGS